MVAMMARNATMASGGTPSSKAALTPTPAVPHPKLARPNASQIRVLIESG
jgi:hypothetical protein